MSNIFKLIFFSLSILMPANLALADDVWVGEVTEKALECGISPYVIEQLKLSEGHAEVEEQYKVALLASLINACNHGLPVRPFELKLTEGLSKQVHPSKIVVVMDRMRLKYIEAQSILEAGTDNDDPELLTIVGDGLVNGVSVEFFSTFIDRHKDLQAPRFSIGLEMASYLVQYGFNQSYVNDIVDSYSIASQIPLSWRYFIRVVIVARERGISDLAIKDAAIKGLQNSGSPNDVASLLGFTLRNMRGQSK
tara:strand:+ start:162 stop:914 length:753 start_codon:yes stop_codon:yes gene_type:complete